MSQMLDHRAGWCYGAGYNPRPGLRLSPLEGAGGLPCSGRRAVLPPVRKSPMRRAASLVVGVRDLQGKGWAHGGGVGHAEMHGSDAPACCADVCRVRDRLRDRPARCHRLRCRCCASVADVMSLSGVMHVDVLGAMPLVQLQSQPGCWWAPPASELLLEALRAPRD